MMLAVQFPHHKERRVRIYLSFRVKTPFSSISHLNSKHYGRARNLPQSRTNIQIDSGSTMYSIIYSIAMKPVRPLRSTGDSLRPTDIPLTDVRQQDYRIRNRDQLDHESFGVKQQKVICEDLKIPMAPCPNIKGWDGQPIVAVPAEPLYIPSGPVWDIPFLLRHRFLNWAYRILEAEFATRAADAGLEFGSMDTMQWKKLFLNNETLDRGEYTLRRGWIYKRVIEMADQIRHAAEHRQNIGFDDMRCGLTLPEVFGHDAVYAKIMSVFGLVRVAGRATAQDDPQTFQTLTEIFGDSRKCGTTTELYTSIQYIVEAAIFQYTERYHPEILAEKGWTVPEQGEMPLWEEMYKEKKLTAKQDVFPDLDDSLLNTCLDRARTLRNVAAHRSARGRETTPVYIHNAIKCLMLLGRFDAAIEVEILAEQFLTDNSRESVLKRLAGEYLEAELPSTDDPLPRRREERRRVAIAQALTDASFSENTRQKSTSGSDWGTSTPVDTPSPRSESPNSSSTTWGDSPPPKPHSPTTKSPSHTPKAWDHSTSTDPLSPTTMARWGIEPPKPPPNPSLIPLPIEVRLTRPDITDILLETANPSMHPVLKTVPAPSVCSLWDPLSYTEDTEISWTEDRYEMCDLPKISAEVQRFRVGFEAEMRNLESSDIATIPLSAYQNLKTATATNIIWTALEHKTPSPEAIEQEQDNSTWRTDVSNYYARVYETMPDYVHLSIRREIRLYEGKLREAPMDDVVEDEEEEPPEVPEDDTATWKYDKRADWDRGEDEGEGEGGERDGESNTYGDAGGDDGWGKEGMGGGECDGEGGENHEASDRESDGDSDGGCGEEETFDE